MNTYNKNVYYATNPLKDERVKKLRDTLDDKDKYNWSAYGIYRHLIFNLKIIFEGMTYNEILNFLKEEVNDVNYQVINLKSILEDFDLFKFEDGKYKAIPGIVFKLELEENDIDITKLF